MRRGGDFDPYHVWLQIPQEMRPPTAYQLLGVDPAERNVEVIRQAKMMRASFLRHRQGGEHAEAVARLLEELEQAALTLADPVSRAAYDAQLKPTSASAPTNSKPDAGFALAAPASPRSPTLATPAEPIRKPRRRRRTHIPAWSHLLLVLIGACSVGAAAAVVWGKSLFAPKENLASVRQEIAAPDAIESERNPTEPPPQKEPLAASVIPSKTDGAPLAPIVGEAKPIEPQTAPKPKDPPPRKRRDPNAPLRAISPAQPQAEDTLASDVHAGRAGRGRTTAYQYYVLNAKEPVGVKTTAILFQAQMAGPYSSSGELIASTNGNDWIRIHNWTTESCRAAAATGDWHVVSLENSGFAGRELQRLVLRFDFKRGADHLAIRQVHWVKR